MANPSLLNLISLRAQLQREREMTGDRAKRACRCCAEEGLKKGAWSAEEDTILTSYVNTHGVGKWRELPQKAGLWRCGRSCRLRWLNYLRPDIKRGNISEDEDDLIIRLHRLLGNRWSLIAGRLPGRTDNEIKNHWNTILSKKFKVIAKKDQCNKSKNRKIKGIPSVEAPKETVENNPNFIQTSATQCNKASLTEREGNHINSNNIDLELELGGESSTQRVSDSSDFLMDVDLDKFCIPDFSESDLLQGHCYEILVPNNATHKDDGISNSSFCCFGHRFPTHETIEKSANEAMLENGIGTYSVQKNSTLDLDALCSFLGLEDEIFKKR